MLRLAREACAAGRRVWWVGLPAQRAAVVRRATLERLDAASGGEPPLALLGLEFLTLQQVYYRLLARARELHPLVIGSGRLVLVGEALAEVAGAVPAPGEARLFAQAIAEAKRFAAVPDSVSDGHGGDPERGRLAAVYAAYERLKAADDGAWDYDDFRAAAAELAARRPDACEVDVVIVDGFRELGPLALRLFLALAKGADVHLTLPRSPAGLELPAGTAVARTAPGAPVPRVERYRAPNPVAEARWVLRSLKRDLAERGLDPLALAVIAPPERVRALQALADEYGVPLVDETPRSLAETPAGRLLVELLELPDYPTPSGVLTVPELAPLADAALSAGVAGPDAIAALAARLGLEERWRAWLATLEVSGEPLAWARQLLAEVVPRLQAGVESGESAAAGGRFEQLALRAAQEASRLADGSGFRAWWAALLRQARLPRELPGGVALTGPTQASGRRFEKAYLLGANEGVYAAGEREDYFVPEEDRLDVASSNARLGLPRRFQGRDAEVFAELLARAGTLVVTFPEADQGGPLLPEPALVGPEPTPLPAVPAGSVLELSSRERFTAGGEPVPLGEPSVAALQRYHDCGFRYWGERRLLRGERPWWAQLRAALREHPRLDAERLEALAASFPEGAAWLRQHAEALAALSYGVRLPSGDEGGAYVRLDAAVRTGTHATLVRFCAPGRALGEADAERYVKDRWSELWAAGHLLARYPGRVTRVDVTVWPILGEPVGAFERGIRYRWRQIENRERRVQDALERFARGEAEPRPGYRCQDCPVFDVCREGRA